MRRCVLLSLSASLALASLSLPTSAVAASEPSPVSGKGVPSLILQGVHRLVFLGDSITQAGDYVADIECWLRAQDLGIEVLNLGLGSETATDLTPEENASHLAKYGFGRPFLSQRLDRVLAATKPDLLFACYGMNDGSSLPATTEGDRRFADAITHLREAALSVGVKRVVICTPPVHDAQQDPTQKAQDQNLARYTTWLLSKRASGWDIVDIHTPMRQALDKARSKDQAFFFAQDGVHPGRTGHWLMAREILVQCFGANFQGVTRAEDLLPPHGSEIRKLICQRMKLLYDAWMTQIGHIRPGVAGGPGAKRSALTVPEAEARAADIAVKIQKLQSLP
jgi:lysophospholipase L1-like esterase